MPAYSREYAKMVCRFDGCPRERMIGESQILGQFNSLSFGVAMPSGEWLGSRTDEGRAKLR
jgi:hypothetical protein